MTDWAAAEHAAEHAVAHARDTGVYDPDTLLDVAEAAIAISLHHDGHPTTIALADTPDPPPELDHQAITELLDQADPALQAHLGPHLADLARATLGAPAPLDPPHELVDAIAAELDTYTQAGARTVRQELARQAGATLDNAQPAVTLNWVEQVGGLPPLIHHLAEKLKKRGHPNPYAIAVAAAKRFAARGQGQHHSNAEWHAAVAEWEAKKAQSHTLDDPPDPEDRNLRRAWIAARQIAQTIWQSIQSGLLGGKPESDQVTDAETAAAGQLRAQANLAAGALNDGREQAATEHAAQIVGVRYTSIMDRNRCEWCAHADDGVTRALDDPVRLARKPPNPACESLRSGTNRCRCVEFYELADQAPTLLDDGPFTLDYHPNQPRDPHTGQWVDVADLTALENLGGSTGAKLYEGPDSRQFVVKRGGGQEKKAHVLEESYADRAYEALGVPVPRHGIDPTGKKVAEFVKGESFDKQTGDRRAHTVNQLKQNFVADALLGNWDVIGLANDNILTDRHGRAMRIDNGGSLRFRAQGARKSTLTRGVGELWTMREQGTAGNVFGDLTNEQLAAQAEAVIQKREALLKSQPDQKVRDLLEKRLASLQMFVEGVHAGHTDSELRAEQEARGILKLHHELEAAMALDDDDPEVLILAQPIVKWEEKEHPRDAHGRFRLVLGGQVFDYLRKAHLSSDPFTLDPTVEQAFANAHTDTVETPTKGTKTWKTIHVTPQTAKTLDEGLAMVLKGDKVSKKPAGPEHNGAKTGRKRILDLIKAAHAQGEAVTVPDSPEGLAWHNAGAQATKKASAAKGAATKKKNKEAKLPPPGQDPSTPKIGKLDTAGTLFDQTGPLVPPNEPESYGTFRSREWSVLKPGDVVDTSHGPGVITRMEHPDLTVVTGETGNRNVTVRSADGKELSYVVDGSQTIHAYDQPKSAWAKALLASGYTQSSPPDEPAVGVTFPAVGVGFKKPGTVSFYADAPIGAAVSGDPKGSAAWVKTGPDTWEAHGPAGWAEDHPPRTNASLFNDMFKNGGYSVADPGITPDDANPPIPKVSNETEGHNKAVAAPVGTVWTSLEGWKVEKTDAETLKATDTTGDVVHIPIEHYAPTYSITEQAGPNAPELGKPKYSGVGEPQAGMIVGGPEGASQLPVGTVVQWSGASGTANYTKVGAKEWKSNGTGKTYTAGMLDFHSKDATIIDLPAPKAEKTDEPPTHSPPITTSPKDLPIGTTAAHKDGTIYTKVSADSWESNQTGDTYPDDYFTSSATSTFYTFKSPGGTPLTVGLQPGDMVPDQESAFDALPVGTTVKGVNGDSSLTLVKSADGNWGTKAGGSPLWSSTLAGSAYKFQVADLPGGGGPQAGGAPTPDAQTWKPPKLKPAMAPVTAGDMSAGQYVQLKKGGAIWRVADTSKPGIVKLEKPGQKGSAQEGLFVKSHISANTPIEKLGPKPKGTVSPAAQGEGMKSIPAQDANTIQDHLDALPVGAKVGATPNQHAPWVKQENGSWRRTSSYGDKVKTSKSLAQMYAASSHSQNIYGQGGTTFSGGAPPKGPPVGSAVTANGAPFVVTKVHSDGSVAVKSMTGIQTISALSPGDISGPWNPDQPSENTSKRKVGDLQAGDLMTLKSGGIGKVVGGGPIKGTGPNAGKVEVEPLDGTQTRYVPPEIQPDKVLLREFYDAKSHEEWAKTQKTKGEQAQAAVADAGAKAATSPKSFTPAKDRLKHLQDTAASSFAGMTKKSRQTLSSYSGSGFSEINGAARSAKIKLTTAQHAKLAALDKAIHEAKPLDENLLLYRGWGGSSGKEAAQAGVGEVIFDHGIMSTSLHSSYMKGAHGYGGGGSGVGLAIEVPKGAQALWVGDNVGGGMSEAEVLLPRHSEFVVLGRFKTASGENALRVRLLLPGEDPTEVLAAAQAEADADPGVTQKNTGTR